MIAYIFHKCQVGDVIEHLTLVDVIIVCRVLVMHQVGRVYSRDVEDLGTVRRNGRVITPRALDPRIARMVQLKLLQLHDES